MKRIMIFILGIWLLAHTTAYGHPMSAPELIRLAQGGASLILDVEDGHWSVPELIRIAQALVRDATLTVKIGKSGKLSTPQCLQISQARPGQVIFWF